MRIGIIGSGFGLYGLLPAFNSVKGCKVVCICGKKTERLQKYCKSIQLDAIYSDWRIMFEKEKLDAVAIAVTPKAQYEITKVALKKGLHVFAEKPLASTLSEAEELFLLTKKNKNITAVDFIFPEIDEWIQAKKNIEDGHYGKLKHVKVDWDFLSYDLKHDIDSWKTNVEEGGGVLSFFTSHVLYYVEDYVGEISKISSIFSYSKKSTRKKIETGIDIIMQFKNGVTGSIHVCSNVIGRTEHKVEFIFEKSTMILKSEKGITDAFTLSVYSESEDIKSDTCVRKKTVSDEDERVAVVAKIAKRFVYSVQTKRTMKPSFKEGLRVQKLIDIIRNVEI
ncbi:MAG: Gfo/Idh/MocA family oxidoreductase [Candidatus Pacebacteria bacterium]|nr:Gfo/Idh/MocA family oxidoreductase [Candidatus Paceibacterota bacterium]